MGVRKIPILGVYVSLINYESALQTIRQYISGKKSAYICVAATHLIVECRKNRYLKDGVNRADMVTPDGMPLVWMLKYLGYKSASRVYGPILTEKICQMSAKNSYTIYLLGGASGQSKNLKNVLEQKYPGIKVSGYFDTPDKLHIPPEVVVKINQSQAGIVFVGLGCPYQELWMIENRKKLKPAVLIGVGAAFDILSGYKKQAPIWMQNIGMEWFFRFIQEPRRLWKRYLVANTLFMYYCLKFGTKSLIRNVCHKKQ
jgi:N-acetylglucosaminyldiphosphoundecaprenol N-acetyl-beta-D-mannosaminyltransferase